MARKTTTKPRAGTTERKRHGEEFKREALGLAEAVGVSEAAKSLGLYSSQLYDWRSKAEAAKSRGQISNEQAKEIARLKRQLADKDEELTIVKKFVKYFAQELK
ncbi:MAG: transposase [Gammaproteobacteria bacterium]|nr:transposase [Gammaproteobacteria bacterium]